MSDFEFKVGHARGSIRKPSLSEENRIFQQAGLDNVRIQSLETHCCGMAGSWGMTADHYDLSRAIGDDLIGQLNRSGADHGVTDCPTCRLQMEEFTNLPIRHPVEIVAARLKDKNGG